MTIAMLGRLAASPASAFVPTTAAATSDTTLETGRYEKYVSPPSRVRLTIATGCRRAWELAMGKVRSGKRVGAWGRVSSTRRLVAAAVCFATLAACAPNTALIVRFPLGNVQRGREAFVALECHACHRIEGVAIAPHPSPASFSVALGGHTPRIETYGDLITAIVNPSHRLARSYRAATGRGEPSPMEARFLNDVMTTQQLVDIAAFLHTEYDYIPPPPPPYWESYPSGDDDPFNLNR
jgi:hypothetical protein